MMRAWDVERSSHQNPMGRRTLATPKTSPQNTGVRTSRAGVKPVVGMVLMNLRPELVGLRGWLRDARRRRGRPPVHGGADVNTRVLYIPLAPGGAAYRPGS